VQDGPTGPTPNTELGFGQGHLRPREEGGWIDVGRRRWPRWTTRGGCRGQGAGACQLPTDRA
jgi:hypothetical protein